jgi:hypothetical protein
MKNANSKGTLSLNWFAGYRKGWWRADILAGLITAAVVIPKAMAFATIAGLPVQVGLYTAFLPMINAKNSRFARGSGSSLFRNARPAAIDSVKLRDDVVSCASRISNAERHAGSRCNSLFVCLD